MAPTDLNSTPDEEIEDLIESSSQSPSFVLAGHVRIDDRIRYNTLSDATMKQMFWSFSFLRLFCYILASEIETFRILMKKNRSLSSRIFGNGNQRIRDLVYAFISIFIFYVIVSIGTGTVVHTEECTNLCVTRFSENNTIVWDQNQTCGMMCEMDTSTGIMDDTCKMMCEANQSTRALKKTCGMMCETGTSTGAVLISKFSMVVSFLTFVFFGLKVLYRQITLKVAEPKLQPIDFKTIPITRETMPKIPKHFQNDFSVVVTFVLGFVFFFLASVYTFLSIFLLFDFTVVGFEDIFFFKSVCLAFIYFHLTLFCTVWFLFSNEILDKKYHDKFCKFNVKLFAYIKHHDYKIQKLDIFVSSQINSSPKELILITQNKDTTAPLIVYSFSY